MSVLLPDPVALYRREPTRPYSRKLYAYPDVGTTWRCSGPVARTGIRGVAGVSGRMCPKTVPVTDSRCSGCSRNPESGLCTRILPDGSRSECPDACCGSLRKWYSSGADVDKTRGTYRSTPCDGFRRMYVQGRGLVCGKRTWDGSLQTADPGCCNSPPPWTQQQPLFEWEEYSRDPQYYGLRNLIPLKP